jgi:AraC family transcriptional regulator, transcriptional activator of pobA
VPPNKWSYHRIGLVTDGSVEFATANNRFRAKKNFLIAMPSRLITSSKRWSKDIRGYILLFNNDFFVKNGLPVAALQNKRILISVLQPFIELADTETSNLVNIFESLIEERGKQEGTVNELLAVKTYELIVHAERLFAEKQQFETNEPVMNIVTQFRDHLENHFMQEHSVGFYARLLNLHPNYLNSLMKTHTGFTTKETIQHRLLLEIKYLLHTTSLSIKEISFRLSFKDPNYLTTFFSRAEKVSPAQYRAAVV